MIKIKHKVFGKDSDPTIYYFTGYGSVMKQYKAHVYTLVKSGYRVVIFDYEKSVLMSGDPEALLFTVKSIGETIRKDRASREVAGAYGVSLGTWIAGAIMTDLDIKYGVYNSGVCSLANVIWTKLLFEDAKKNFQQHGYSQEDLEKYWSKLDARLMGDKFSNKILLVMNGTDDEIVDVRETREAVKKWRESGNEVTTIETPKLKHSYSIKRNMLRVKTVSKFFANKSTLQS